MFDGGLAHAGSYRGTHVCANGYCHARADCHSRADCDAGAHGDASACANRDGHAIACQRARHARADRGADPDA